MIIKDSLSYFLGLIDMDIGEEDDEQDDYEEEDDEEEEVKGKGKKK